MEPKKTGSSARSRLGLVAKAFAGLALALVATGCYYIKQGTRLISYQSQAVAVDRLLADPATQAELRSFLELTKRVRVFAVKVVGLKETGNYSSYADIGRDNLAWVVSACGALSFERHYWDYPFVGKLPYKGFFDEEDARAEALSLKTSGLDVITRKVDAFSTLGWLEDPLYSFMRDYSEYAIANLLIHELAHSTLFLRDQQQFNEEFATFVGDRGAMLWLEREYGVDGDEVKAARDAIADSDAFMRFLGELAAGLEAAYSSAASDDEKLAEKTRILAEAGRTFLERYDATFKTGAYRGFDASKINNAYLDLYRLYQGEPTLYRDYFERVCSSDLATFVAKVVELSRGGGDAKAAMLASAGGTPSP